MPRELPPPGKPSWIARVRAAWRWLDIEELLFGFCAGAACGFLAAALYYATLH